MCLGLETSRAPPLSVMVGKVIYWFEELHLFTSFPFRTSASGPTYASVLGLHGKVLVAGGYVGGFCEKPPEASPISNRANANGGRCCKTPGFYFSLPYSVLIGNKLN